MRFLKYTFLALIVFTQTRTLAQVQRQVPDVLFDVAVRQKSNGVLDKAVHLFQLKCSNGECTLISVTLNRCFDDLNGNSTFIPVLQHSSTREGNLKVINLGDQLEVTETMLDFSGETTFRYLFPFSKKSGDELPKFTSFSGGYVKHSTILNSIVTVEYVPFVGKFAKVKLDCGTLTVPGVDATK